MKPPVGPDPGATIPGITPGGEVCSCEVPPINIKALHDQDKDYLRHVDIYNLKSMIKQKPENDHMFGESFAKFKKKRDRVDHALAELVDRYSDFRRQKLELQTAQQGVQYIHMARCRPLKEAYSLHLPCHEDYREAMELYRSLVELPSCTVGASLPLVPAAVACADADGATAGAVGAAAAASTLLRPGCRTAVLGVGRGARRGRPGQDWVGRDFL